MCLQLINCEKQSNKQYVLLIHGQKCVGLHCNDVGHLSSDVASYGALGHVPLKFWKFCAFCSCCQLGCKNFEITKERRVLHRHTRLSRQKHTKTHVNRLKVLELKKSWAGQEKFLLCPHHLISWRRHCT